jgi:hypothetical protein
MYPKVLRPAKGEERVASYIREDALRAIEEIGDLDRVAELLDAPRYGVEKIIKRNPWEIQTAFRVAEALGLRSIPALEQTAAESAISRNSVF